MRHTIFGESHGPAIGVVLEQVPAGIELDQQEIAQLQALLEELRGEAR